MSNHPGMNKLNTSHLLSDDSAETLDAECQESSVAKAAHLGAAREQRMRLLQDCAYRYLNHNVSNCQSYITDMNIIASCASTGFDCINARVVDMSLILQRVVTLLTMK